MTRDFVELPSQIMENWLLEPEVLKVYAKHYETGEVIPDELVAKIQAAEQFNQGFTSVEYLVRLLSWTWTGTPSKTRSAVDVNEFEKASMDKIGLIPEIVVRYRSTYFTHITGGYSAGYYSYIWSEVLDADAFQAFKETSLFDQETALAFRTNILETGRVRRSRGALPALPRPSRRASSLSCRGRASNNHECLPAAAMRPALFFRQKKRGRNPGLVFSCQKNLAELGDPARQIGDDLGRLVVRRAADHQARRLALAGDGHQIVQGRVVLADIANRDRVDVEIAERGEGVGREHAVRADVEHRLGLEAGRRGRTGRDSPE